MIELFQLCDFILASGARCLWRIECDAITPAGWEALALMAAERLPPFGSVYGVPRGGLPFAEAMKPHRTPGCRRALVCEDVVTTGGSISRFVQVMKDDPQELFPWCVGVCVFARGTCPKWVIPLFQMAEVWKE